MATMAHSWKIILVCSLIYELVVASPARLQPRAITAACQAGETANCITSSVTATTKTGTVSGKTITDTFFPTTLSQFSTITAPTTITTQDASGATVLAILGAAGAGYLVYQGALGAGAAVVLDPPPLPTVAQPEFTFAPTTSAILTSTSAPSPVSSSEAWTLTVTQTRVINRQPNLQKFVPLIVPQDVRTCNLAGQSDATVRLEYAKDSILTFCKDKALQDASQGPLSSVFSPGAGKILNISVSALPLGCSSALGQTKMPEDACNVFLSEALNGCDTGSNTEKHGGVIKNGCLQYSLTPQVSDGVLSCTPSDLPDLPTLPGVASTGVQYTAQTGVNRDEALADIFDFCSLITTKFPNGRDIKPKEVDNLRYYYNPSKGNTQMNISLSYSDQVSCTQSGDKSTYRVDRESCKRLLGERVVDGCNTKFTGSYGKFGGQLTDGCGIYAIQTKGVEPIACHSDGENISDDVATSAINQFCDRGYHLDPNATAPAFAQSPPDGFAWDTYLASSIRVNINLDWGSLPQNTGCQNTRSRFAVGGDECRRRLHAVMSKCGAKGGQMGAQQHEGCVTWDMKAVKN